MSGAHRFPESSVFYRKLRVELPLAVAAEGSWIVDESGKRYLDASGGAAVANLGHDLREIAADVAREIRTLGYINGTQFTHRAVERLADELARRLPGDLRYSYFLSSGSEAVEAAVKLARQFQVESGRPEKWRILSRVPSYHGNTLAALALSGRESYRAAYGPLLLDLPRVPAPDTYRWPKEGRTTGESFEAELERLDPRTIAAFIAEPIGGSSSGATVPPPEYWRHVVEACRRHDVLVIADEVMCGMGRTGRWLASNHFHLVPDILVLGKGLNAGAVPLSAVVARPGVVETLAHGSGFFRHAQTYSHHPAACAAGLATLRVLEREHLVERVARLESHLFGVLERLRAHPLVGDVRGKGFIAAVELVEDRTSRRSFPRARHLAETVAERALANGLVVWPNAGNVDGETGDLVMIAPPFTATEEELDEIGVRLAKTLEEIE